MLTKKVISQEISLILENFQLHLADIAKASFINRREMMTIDEEFKDHIILESH